MNAEKRFYVESLGRALTEIGAHAADMQLSEEIRHEGCLHCETAILLARVVSFGRQERDVQLQGVPRG